MIAVIDWGMNREQRRLIAKGVYPKQIKPGSQEEEWITLQYVEEQLAKAQETGETLHLSEHELIGRLKEACNGN